MEVEHGNGTGGGPGATVDSLPYIDQDLDHPDVRAMVGVGVGVGGRCQLCQLLWGGAGRLRAVWRVLDVGRGMRVIRPLCDNWR